MVLVTHVVTGTNVGGAEIMLYRYLRALGDKAANQHVISLLPHGPVSEMISALGVPVSTLNMRNLASAPAAAVRLARKLDQIGPDVIHGWMYHGCLVSTIARKLIRRKPALVWGIHHSLANLKHEKRATRVMLQLLKRMSGSVDHITYCSEVARQQHRRVGFSDRNDTLIPNAIDCDEFRPDPQAAGRLRAICGTEPGTLLVGNVARAHPMKDHVSLVRAVAMVRQAGLDAHLILIGHGHAGGPAEAEAERLQIAPHLTTLPARGDIAQLVPGLDLFALSSAWGEAQSLALVEAMAACVPCITTDMGDCASMVGDPQLVVPPGQPQALADAMARVLSMPAADRQRIGQAARHRVETLLSLDTYTSDHAKVYRKALSHRLPALSEAPT